MDKVGPIWEIVAGGTYQRLIIIHMDNFLKIKKFNMPKLWNHVRESEIRALQGSN